MECHVRSFEHNDVTTINDIRMLSDADFLNMGFSMGLRNRVRGLMHQLAQVPSTSSTAQPSRAKPMPHSIQASMFSFARDPATAAASQAAKSAGQAAAVAATMHARAQGQFGGLRKAANSREDKQLAGSLRTFFNSPSGPSRADAASEASFSSSPSQPPQAHPRSTSPHSSQPETPASPPSDFASAPTEGESAPAPSGRPAGKQKETRQSLLAAIGHEKLRHIADLFTGHATKAVTYGDSCVTLSVALRKEWAEYSYEPVDSQQAERGLARSVREVHQAVVKVSPIL
jgi:hypothetical protein